MDPRLLSIEDVATQLNVSTSTVRRWVRSGKLVGQKAGVQWRFDSAVVRKALEDGTLSGVSRSFASATPSTFGYPEPPESAMPLLAQWRDMLVKHLERVQPDHVVVTDRRGSKIWSMIMPGRYVWGRNLWHSTIFKLVPPEELKHLFSGQRVLVFDEIMQRGREMHELKRTLEGLGAEAMTVVCVRQRSHADAGDLLDYDTYVLEDVDDIRFSERAAVVSRLISRFEPPLDADHIVVRGRLNAKVSGPDLLERMAKWGIPILVWPPDNHHKFLAITLDRPQFFNTLALNLPNVSELDGFTFDWDGPCKVRLYINLNTGLCYCSFIVYPRMTGRQADWFALSPTGKTKQAREEMFASGNRQDAERLMKRLYSTLCLHLATKLFREFVASGAAHDLGLQFAPQEALDPAELRATFGDTLGRIVTREVREVLANSDIAGDLFPDVSHPPTLSIRRDRAPVTHLNDLFQCRTDFLKAIPQRTATSSGGSALRPIAYSDLLDLLSKYPEATIGRILDYELDRGTAKPVVYIEFLSDEPNPVIGISRGFFRGEFGPWFEFDTRELSDRDLIIQRTMALGPTVIEGFLKQIGDSVMIATHFNKVFANLQHDWRDAYDLLYLGWRPYKYGPVAVVPDAWASGEFKPFDRFLVDRRCLSEKREAHGTRQWPRYTPADESVVPWRRLYREKTTAVTRAHVSGLVRLYGQIQNKCKTTRARGPRSSGLALFQDPLVILASARNEDIAYKCGWFEVRDWVAQGQGHLFPMLKTLPLSQSQPSQPFLKHDLERFAAPARLLFDKIEMYRNLPYLRKQVEELCAAEGLDAGEILLETTDVEPKFQSDSGRPMQNLDWACNIMRPFSSLVRQVLTNCKYDTPTERAMNAGTYLGELFQSCPELKTLEKDLRFCIDESQKGFLTEEIVNCLDKAFSVICVLFDIPGKIPDPRPSYERERERLESRNGLIQVLNGIREQVSEPYAVAVADIKNIEHLSNFADIFKIPSGEAMSSILGWVEQAARAVASKHTEVLFTGMTSDNVIFAGRSCDEVFLCTHELTKQTFRQLKDVDYNQLAHFGLLRAGIAWCDGKVGPECEGIKPGLTAYHIGDMHGQPLGSIAITKDVYDRLSPALTTDFQQSTQQSAEKIQIYTRPWVHERDSR